MITLLQLQEKVKTGDLTLTKGQAFELPLVLNRKAGQEVDFDWDRNIVWISVWNIEFTIVDEIVVENQGENQSK